MRWVVNRRGKSFKNASIIYFNDIGDKIILDTEYNSRGIIAIPSISITLENYHIHVLHNLPKRYIYKYLISKLISSEETIQNTVSQNIYLLLI